MTPTLATRVVHVAVRLCAVSSLVRHVSVMASETLVRTGTRGRPVVLEAAMRGGKRSGGSWQVAGVHGADITGASALHAEEEPQHSNDFRWVLWRQARSCQHCGHRAAQERESVVRTVEPGSSLTGSPPPLPARHLCRVPAVMVRLRPRTRACPSRPTPRGSGSTGQGLCLLHEGPTYPKCPPPSSSSTPPSCSASRRRRQPPQRPGQPLRQVETAALPSGRRTQPVS